MSCRCKETLLSAENCCRFARGSLLLPLIHHEKISLAHLFFSLRVHEVTRTRPNENMDSHIGSLHCRDGFLYVSYRWGHTALTEIITCKAKCEHANGGGLILVCSLTEGGNVHARLDARPGRLPSTRPWYGGDESVVIAVRSEAR